MFKKSEIAAQVRQTVIDLCGYPQEQVTEEKDPEKDLFFDELDMTELQMDLEETFGITISEDEANAQHTVGDWIGLVEGRLEAEGRVEKGGETR